MSSGEKIFITMLAVLAIGSVTAIVAALVLSRRRARLWATGPGDPSVPVPTDPWRRFTGAIAAPYARQEWQNRIGSGAAVTPDQTYLGYASPSPTRGVAQRLRKDWRVSKPAQASRTAQLGAQDSLAQAAHVLAARGEQPEAVRERLVSAGAPRDVVDALVAFWPEPHGPVDERALGTLAFDVGRRSCLVRWSAVTVRLGLDEAHHCSDAQGVAALSVFSGWDDYGRHYLAGLDAFTRSGRKPYRKAVAWLTSDQQSPWRTEPWPR